MPKKKKEEAQTPLSQYYYPKQQSSQPSMILVILLIAVAFFAGYLFFKVQNLEKKGAGDTAQVQQGQQPQQPQQPVNVKPKKPSTNEHWRGSTNVRYVWIEYSDLECPFCKKIHPDLVKIMSENANNVAWVFRHFPLSFHPKAQKSAEAVECVAELGGNDSFWKMTDTIYEKMPDMQLTDLPSIASQVGVDQAAFKTCLDSGKFEKKVKDGLKEGTTAGVQATPTSVIYDLQTDKSLTVEGAVPYDQLKQQFDAFFKK